MRMCVCVYVCSGVEAYLFLSLHCIKWLLSEHKKSGEMTQGAILVILVGDKLLERKADASEGQSVCN